MYKLSVDGERESKAKLWFRDLDEIIAQEPYKVTLTLKNVGDEDYPGGVFLIEILYQSKISHSNPLSVPEIKKDEKKNLRTN